MKPSLFAFPYGELKDYLKHQLGLKSYLGDQIYDWLFRKFNLEIDQWSNIAVSIRAQLKEHFDCTPLRILWQGTSVDGTRKFLFQLADQKSIEAVLIPGKNRWTLCLSSQVGCAMGCNFCHTATQGLSRHLTAAEVVGQYMTLANWLMGQGLSHLIPSNIVYMGQGEPLHNFEAMKKATEVFIEPKGLAISQRKITLSTSGLAPQIERLSEFPPINLAISLHSPRDEVRSELMPINKAYNLERLFQAIDKVPLKAHRRITYEYLLIAGLTDTLLDIQLLEQALNPKESKINLIPFNEFPGSKYKRPSNDQIAWFHDQLLKRGLSTTVRLTKGEDILAACGQLKTVVEAKQKASAQVSNAEEKAFINIWDKGKGDNYSYPAQG